VALPAENPDHGLQGFALPLDFGVGFYHGDNIRRPAPDGKPFSASGPAAQGYMAVFLQFTISSSTRTSLIDQ
jgi:hypothetical protein